MSRIKKNNDFLDNRIALLIIILFLIIGCIGTIWFIKKFEGLGKPKFQDSKSVISSFNDNINVSVTVRDFPDIESSINVVCNDSLVLVIDADEYSDIYDYVDITQNFCDLLKEYKDGKKVFYEFDWGIIYSLDSGQSFYGVPKHVYNSFSLKMSNAFSEFNTSHSSAIVYGEPMYFKDTEIFGLIYNLDMNITAEKITDSVSKYKYIEANTLSEEQERQYAAAGKLCKKSLDKATLEQINEKAEVKMQEHIQFLNMFGIYEDVLEELGFTEEQYKENTFNSFLYSEMLENEFSKTYQAGNYSFDELKELKDGFVTSILAKEKITVK